MNSTQNFPEKSAPIICWYQPVLMVLINIRQFPVRQSRRRKEKLEEEFKMIGEYARANFQKERSVSRLEKNLTHNRYLDIGKIFLSQVFSVDYIYFLSPIR